MVALKIEIDPTFLDAAPTEKRLEWQILSDELVNAEDFAFSEKISTLRIALPAQQTILQALNADGTVAKETLAHDEWLDLRREYLTTIDQMQSTNDPALPERMEVLDMAKKATHDRAARWLRKRLEPFELNVATARRLFSLLISLLSQQLNTRKHKTVRPKPNQRT